MKIVLLRSFEKDFKKLPKQFQQTTLKKLSRLTTHRGHPSLRTKKIKGCENIWEGSISTACRFTYHIDGAAIFLRRIGTHSILEKP